VTPSQAQSSYPTAPVTAVQLSSTVFVPVDIAVNTGISKVSEVSVCAYVRCAIWIEGEGSKRGNYGGQKKEG